MGRDRHVRLWPIGVLLAGCLEPPSSEVIPEDAGTATPDGNTITSFSGDSIHDTYLRLDAPTLNYGLRQHLCVDQGGGEDRTPLIRVDLAEIPTGASLARATLHVWTRDNGSVETHSVYEVLEPWDEGDTDGGLGAASWNERLPGQPWTAPGAGAGSRAEAASGSFIPEAEFTEYVVELDVDLVSRWIDAPLQNHGVAILGSGTDGVCFPSSERPDLVEGPRMTLTWAP